MRFGGHGLLLAALIFLVCGAIAPAQARAQTGAPDDPDFQVQGEYAGKLVDGQPADVSAGVQIVAEGDGHFSAVLYRGGLPGAGWKLGDDRQPADGEAKDGRTDLHGTKWNGTLESGKLSLTRPDGTALGTLAKIERKSPTLGQKPPEGAIVLFDGTDVGQWAGARITADHTLGVPAVTRRSFGDFVLHLEFCLPFSPTARGQNRGNSGVYLQNRYEVQILDSFGLAGEDNECGAIYRFRAPDVNMCFPPLAWQTYDIEFSAARFDVEHKKTRNARVTVKHNGVTIHDDVELKGPTHDGSAKEFPGTGPLQLQWHVAAVTYRNIWVLEKSAAKKD